MDGTLVEQCAKALVSDTTTREKRCLCKIYFQDMIEGT